MMTTGLNERSAVEDGDQEEKAEEFGELIRYTLFGYGGGLLFGLILDMLGFQRSPIGQWLVRTLAGEGESLLEGLFALRQRLRRAQIGMAEAYGWGKLVGMSLPWWIDWGSRIIGVDVYGVPGFYIPYFYAMSDQIGGNLSGLILLRRSSRSWGEAFSAYFRHPVMLSGLVIILAVPIGLFLARSLGFSPSTQVLTALETIIANLCWAPPLIGWVCERRSQG